MTMAPTGVFTFGQSPASGFGATTPGFGATSQGTAGGFSFGGSTAATPATGGFSFGSTAKTTAAATGFSFGGTAAKTTAPSAGGFSFGSPAPATGGFAATPNTGFSFGTPAAAATPTTTAAATGFSLGGQTATPAPAMGGFSFNTPTANPAPATGFSLGSTTGTPGFGTPAAGGGGFSFGTAAAAATPAAAAPTAAAAAPAAATTNPGFSFGSTAPATGFGTSFSAAATTAGATPAATSSGNWLLGAKPQSTVAPTANPLGAGTTGSLFGQQPAASGGIGGLGTLAQPAAAAATAAATTKSSLFGNISFGKTTAPTGLTSTTPGTGFSLTGLGGTTTTSVGFGMSTPSLGGGTGFSLGSSGFGFNSTTTSTTSITGSIPSCQVASKGLGGVDPKVSIATSDGSGANGKQANSKILKETQLPQQLLVCVNPLKKYIKSEKAIRENITRMSTKSMIKVQTELSALRQILGSVSNGVQRNVVLVEKLKKESVQELKNTEMCQRTEDMSAVLQDENVAPTEYFQSLFEDFEVQMKAYKGEIQNLESHILSLHQPSRLSPEELTMLLHKSHENFLALAAHFHQVHESVKTLKEKYLNYRRIFLGDTKDVFENKRKLNKRSEIPSIESQQGPNPFTGFPSTTAIALAAALSRNQQAPSGPPTIGLGSNTLGQHRGFGSTFNNQSSIFGNTGANTTTNQPSLFGGMGSTSTFGTSMNNPSLFGSNTTKPGFSFGQGTSTSSAATSAGFSFGSNTAAVKPLR
ncbi:nucleoporin p58/p45-like isoform X3 [Argonauta hians]